MKISINILEKELMSYITTGNILETGAMDIEFYEVYEPDTSCFTKNCLYLCSVEELPQPDLIPDGSNFLCNGILAEKELMNYRHLNLLLVTCADYKKLINKAVSIFEEYRKKEEMLDQAISSGKYLHKILDIASQIVGAPLCMLDMNHNVLAMSSAIEPQEDSLWDIMKKGYGYQYYDIVMKSQPRLQDVIKALGGVIETTSNISGSRIRVQALHRGNEPVAVMGLHAMQILIGLLTSILFSFLVM